MMHRNQSQMANRQGREPQKFDICLFEMEPAVIAPTQIPPEHQIFVLQEKEQF